MIIGREEREEKRIEDDWIDFYIHLLINYLTAFHLAAFNLK